MSGVRSSLMEAGAGAAMVPEAAVPVNVTMSPNYMEPVRLVQFNPVLAAVAMAMIICFFLVGFATGYLRKCIRPAEADVEEDFVRRHAPGRRGAAATKSKRGLDSEVLATLPRIQYKDLPTDEKMRKYVDCPVCLAPFDTHDSLRLLPACSHIFHSDCIDVWFLSHSTCPLCRASLALPSEKPGREERERDAAAGEGSEAVEVVIDRDADYGARATSSEPLEVRPGGVLMVSSSAAGEKEQAGARGGTAVGSLKPAVRIVIAPEKDAALASIRRWNSAGTDFQSLHPSYIVDSEGTQYSRSHRAHVINVEELREAQAQMSGSFSRHSRPGEVEASGSRQGPQLAQSLSWSSPNLRQFAP